MAGRSIIRRSGNQGWIFTPDEVATRAKKSQREDGAHQLHLHGTVGAIVWGYHTAAALTSWRIAKNGKGEWTLTAIAERVEPFQLRQTPLQFTAPRAQASHWCWPVRELSQQGNQLHATLGPVEF